MADMISADEAKALLGCDDATLENYINNGTIRAQRVGADLMLQREDVENLGATNPTTDSDDGTIILSGDSEDLSIDLGEVVDDGAQTVVEGPGDAGGPDTLTFGDELEEVNFDDGNTQELDFDDAGATDEGLTFTDSNTAIHTDVDETVVGTGTATATGADYQTMDYDDEAEVSQSTVRRSVRSQRVREEVEQVSWPWPTLLILTTLLIGLFVAPYLVMMLAQNGNLRSNQDDVAANHGVTDNMWTNLAGTFAGFSVEPHAPTFQSRQTGDAQHVPIQNNPGWRYEQFRGQKSPEERIEDFVIDTVEVDNSGTPTQAKSIDEETGNILKTFPVKSHKPAGSEGDDDAGDGRGVEYRPVIRF